MTPLQLRLPQPTVADLFYASYACPVARPNSGSVLVAGPHGIASFTMIGFTTVECSAAGASDEVHIDDGRLVCLRIDGSVEAANVSIFSPDEAPQWITLLIDPLLATNVVSTVVSGGLLGICTAVDGRATVELFNVETYAPIPAARIVITDWTDGDELVLVSQDLLAVGRDLGVDGYLVTLLDRVGVVWSGVGISWWHCQNSRTMVIAVPGDDYDDLIVFDTSDGRKSTTVATTGRIGTVGGDADVALLAVFDGCTENVWQLSVRGSSASFTKLGPGLGKVVVGRGTLGWMERSASNGVAFRTVPVDSALPQLSSTRIVTRCAHEQSRSMLSHTMFDIARPSYTVVHLHGGPESYETNEPRLFGLPAVVCANGGRWISLNYTGSRNTDRQSTTAAWHNWEQTFSADLEWALTGATGPVVMVGWSFGAALALATCRSDRRVTGAIIGGTMSNLRAHVKRATEIDARHGAWFSRRFDLVGSDAAFLSGSPPPSRRDLNVLSFHGRDDDHCPYDLFEATRRRWRSQVTSWHHVDLPGGGHYAETLDDALIIRQACDEFLAAHMASTL